MKLFKSHFWYYKSQRNGVFLLVIIIVLLQSFIVFDWFSSGEKIDAESAEILAFHQQIDSLRLIELENKKLKIYPFNPNYITDYKGERLGMSVAEVDRLLLFRKTGKFINSKEEFQTVTQVSDSLLNAIAPFFKFPDWVVQKQLKKDSNTGKYVPANSKAKISVKDINTATAEDFKTIYGIGDELSERIIKYRSKLQGFSYNNQIFEVWGLEKDVAQKVVLNFKVIEKPVIKKQNVNTVTFSELLKNPYINYELCKKIFEYRDEVAEIQSLTELQHIKDFPLELYDRIVLYLLAE